MAENKKSFIVYSDWRDTFDQLPDSDAGKLIKHIFSYVNDEKPKIESVLINAVFAQIKNTLKRDLEKWDKQLEQRKKAGKKSAEMRATKSNDRSTTVETRRRNSTVNVNVSDNVNDNVNVNVIKKELFNSKEWINVITKNNQLTLELTNNLLKDFFNELESKEWRGTAPDAKKYFVNWMKYQKIEKPVFPKFRTKPYSR